MTFKINMLEAWGDRVPILSTPAVHDHEFEDYKEAYDMLHTIAHDYPDEEIERLGNNMLEIRFKMSETQARKEFNLAHAYVKIIFFITKEY